MKEWQLKLETRDGKVVPIPFKDLEDLKDVTIPVEDYVPRKQAEAVLFRDIMKQYSISSDFSHAIFTAEDGFTQKIDSQELGNAFLVFKQKGEPLTKGYPVRLYVPGNESDCLNVKSVVSIQLVNE